MNQLENCADSSVLQGRCSCIRNENIHPPPFHKTARFRSAMTLHEQVLLISLHPEWGGSGCMILTRSGPYTRDHDRASSLSLGQSVHRLPSGSRPGSEKASKWHADMPPLSTERRWELARWSGVSEDNRDHLQAEGARVENLHSREMEGERRPE